MPSIRDALKESNPWWNQTFKVIFRDREVYHKIQPFLKMPQIIAFTGLRRVGKTTLMYKIVQDRIEGNASPRSIIYFSFDEFRNVEIRDIISEYESIVGESLKEGSMLLLDEVQKLNGWEDQLKRIYDLNKDKIKIIISGSESLFIRKKSKETLGGRIFEFKISTLSFKEFLVFKGANVDNVEINSKELSRLFDKFLLTLGFPELIYMEEPEAIRKYVRESVLEKVLYNDIPKIFNIDDPSLLESITNIIADSPGEIINVQDLANDLHISRHTASNYLFYLENAFLIRKLYNFSRNKRKVERKLKKYYPEIISTGLLFKDEVLYRSKVFEWIIVKSLNAEFFWRDAYKNEVDIIIPDAKPVPIEIKYGKIDASGIVKFLTNFKGDKGYIISYKEETTIKSGRFTIDVIPAYKFLLSTEMEKLGQTHKA